MRGYWKRAAGLALLTLCCACGRTGFEDAAPSDDPADWPVDTGLTYRLELGEPRWVVPSDSLPSRIRCQPACNNVDIHFFGQRLFLAFRTAPNHFASDRTELYVLSSTDQGAHFDFETRVAMGCDLREPRLLAVGDELQLIFFEAGVDMLAFEPRAVWRTFRIAQGEWTAPEKLFDAPLVPWDVKLRSGRAWMSAYAGEHYTGELGELEVYFQCSDDGRSWQPVGSAERVYRGGVSEVAFEFDADGSLWAVTRNEDGDASGFGSHVCTAPADKLDEWTCSAPCDPERYDSPELFRHGDEIYLIARRDVGGPFGPEGDLVAYSLRPKRSAIYGIDKAAHRVVHLQDIPGVGDTAFPAVRRTGAHSFLLANYSSPLDEPDISWLEGQASARGTQIYLLDVELVPE
ncbi:MAG: exo-alpha-sialidase [Deltaproteobacteria bacterium]|nr:exo-alpha-sialidase [Deltaproteobacteria bacterium]